MILVREETTPEDFHGLVAARAVVVHWPRAQCANVLGGTAVAAAGLQQPALAAFGGREVPALAAAQTEAQIEHFIRQNSDTEYHPVGSCRMGPGPLDVVDSELRVHGLQGLRVVDASVMPRIISGNTNAPTIMVAEKAADLIKAAARTSEPVHHAAATA